MVPGQEANSDNLGNFFLDFLQFHDIIRKRKSLNICFIELLEGFYRD